MASATTGQRNGTAAAITLIATGFASSTLVTPLYALYQQRFGFSTIVLTIVYAAYVIGNLGALLFLGRLSDRIGRRRVGMAALTIALMSTALFLAARGPVWIFAGRAVSGLAVGLASGTGAAWLIDLDPEHRDRATLRATLANMAGIGLSPLIAGILAQFAPLPMLLPYAFYAAIAAAALGLVAHAQETVDAKPVDAALFRPQLSLPSGSRGTFIAPAATAFAVFAFGGYYIALLPTILHQALNLTGPAISGAVLAELFGCAALAMYLTRRLHSRAAMVAGLLAIAPGLMLIVLAQAHASLALLLIATAFAGGALAVGYRGSLAIVNRIAPADARAGLVSSYLVICFIGNAIPVIGVAVAARRRGQVGASELFAGVMLVIVAAAIAADRLFAAKTARDRSAG